MLNSNPSLFARPSDHWDTSYARKFLLIPEDELKVFNNSSEKSTPEQKIRQQDSSKDKLNDQIPEEPLIPRLEKPVKAVDELHNSIESSNIKVALVHTSDLFQKKRSELSINAEKHQCLDSILLCRSRTIEVTSVIPEKKLSSSAPGKQTLEGISFNMSTEHHTFSKSDKLPQLNTTYIVPTVLDDKTNNIQTVSDEPCKIITKKKSEKLDGQVSIQSILEKPSISNVPKFGGAPVFSTNPVQKPVDRENFLSKKLKLLEKRFSPSKEFSLVSSSEETLKPECFLKSDRIQKNTTSIRESDDILVSQVNVSAPNVVYKEINFSKAASNNEGERATSTFPSTQSPEKATSMQKELLGEMDPSRKEYIEEIPLKSNTSVFEEESFISQPFPCGQPPSNTQFSTKSSIPNRPETQSSIECQGAESTVKENLAEKTNRPLDVFYEKCNAKFEVNDLVPVKDKAGGKRKRKSKGDKPSKKLLNAKSLVCIQYTDKQVQDMIDIIKNFQFEKKN